MTTLDTMKIKTEVCVFLRNANILSTTLRGVTTATDNITTTTATTYNLSQYTVKNVRTVTYDGAAIKNYTEYQINYMDASPATLPTITLTTAPTAGKALVVMFDYGSNDRIFPDMPRTDLTLGDYPRLAVDIVSGNTKWAGLGANAMFTNLLMSIPVWDTKVKSVEDYTTAVRLAMFNARKSFYYFAVVGASRLSPLIVATERNDRLFQRTQDFEIQLITET